MAWAGGRREELPDRMSKTRTERSRVLPYSVKGRYLTYIKDGEDKKTSMEMTVFLLK